MKLLTLVQFKQDPENLIADILENDYDAIPGTSFPAAQASTNRRAICPPRAKSRSNRITSPTSW